jgi:hypothetical protein
MAGDWRDEKTRELIRRWQAGDRDAGGELCDLHHGFIRRQALAMAGRMGRIRDDHLLADLEQSGRVGMLHAAGKAEPDAPNTLLGYLGTWSFQAMWRSARGFWLITPPHRQMAKRTRGADAERAASAATYAKDALDGMLADRRTDPCRQVDDADEVRVLLGRTTPGRADAIRAMYGIGREKVIGRVAGAERGVHKNTITVAVRSGIADMRESIGVSARRGSA